MLTLVKDMFVWVYSDMDDVDFSRVNASVLKNLSHSLGDRDDGIVAVLIFPSLLKIADRIVKPSP